MKLYQIKYYLERTALIDLDKISYVVSNIEGEKNFTINFAGAGSRCLIIHYENEDEAASAFQDLVIALHKRQDEFEHPVNTYWYTTTDGTGSYNPQLYRSNVMIASDKNFNNTI